MNSLTAKAESLHDAGKYKEAEALFAEVLQEDPTHPGKLFNLAKALHHQGKEKEAILKYCDVLVAPGEYPVYKANAANNLGLILSGYGKTQEAVTAFEFALSLIDNFAPAENNLGNLLLKDGDFHGALKRYDSALKMDGKCFDACMNCGTVQLATGDMPRGWRNYEYRWKTASFATKPIIGQTRWKGQSLEGKTILLTGEQGKGDAIMGVRYAPLVRERYNPERLLYHGHRETMNLFRHVQGIDELSCVTDPNDVDPSTYDYHCPLFSLPDIFSTRLGDVPHDTYIHVPGEFGLVDTGKLRVAMVWAGSPGHANDKDRSVLPSLFEPLSKLDGIDWFSLQVGESAKQCPSWAKDLSPYITDYTDTAQALNELDLVISVDTSVVHLAGAMGRPTWTLIPYSPDWRWMLTGDESPWYPSIRLFRQETKGDWADVVTRIKPELAKLSANHRVSKTTPR